MVVSDQNEQKNNENGDHCRGDEYGRPVFLCLATLRDHRFDPRREPEQHQQADHAEQQFFSSSEWTHSVAIG